MCHELFTIIDSILYLGVPILLNFGIWKYRIKYDDKITMIIDQIKFRYVIPYSIIGTISGLILGFIILILLSFLNDIFGLVLIISVISVSILLGQLSVPPTQRNLVLIFVSLIFVFLLYGFLWMLGIERSCTANTDFLI